MTAEYPQTRHNLGSKFRYAVFECMVRCRLVVFARFVLFFVVLYYTLLPQIRRRCAAYLAHRFPDAGPLQNIINAYRLYWTFGNILLDRMVAGISGRFLLHATAPYAHHCLSEAGKNPQGCIILSAHVGAWQIGLAGLDQFDSPVNIVQMKTPDDPDKHYFERGRGKPFHIIDASDPVGSLIEASAALKRGEIVCLMGDRLPANTPTHHCVKTPFLGGEICLPLSAYALASSTGADLLMLFTVREKGFVTVWHVEHLDVPRGLSHRQPDAFRPYAVRFARAMEAVVKYYPYQFFNFYDMWV